MKEYPLKYNNLTTRIISEYAKVCDGKVKTNPRCVRNFIKQNTIKILKSLNNKTLASYHYIIENNRQKLT